jgi:Trk K+ transport system NAD-binding subunit
VVQASRRVDSAIRTRGDANIIAIPRGAHMMVPNASMLFEAGDRLIVVTHTRLSTGCVRSSSRGS